MKRSKKKLADVVGVGDVFKEGAYSLNGATTIRSIIDLALLTPVY